MSTNIDTKTTAAAILAGDHDDDLDALVDAIRARKQIVARANLRTLAPGETVRFAATTRPKYLAGGEATIVRIAQATATVTLNQSIGRFDAGTEIRVPAELLERPRS